MTFVRPSATLATASFTSFSLAGVRRPALPCEAAGMMICFLLVEPSEDTALKVMRKLLNIFLRKYLLS